MLEHVALNQTRFNTPGVAPDNRGILLGKQGVVLLSSVDRLVGFFRVFCDESSMDDLLPKLKIVQVRTPLETREFLVFFHATSSYLVDRAARIAGLWSGLAFTGSGKHYVKYRDNASPLGFDIGALHSDPADFVLYAGTFTQGYARVKEVPFDSLLFRLALRPVPGEDLADRELVWLTARRGLGRSVLTYLWRNHVRADASYVVPDGPTGAFRESSQLLLVRVHQLPERMYRLFAQVPGLELHRASAENLVVQVGYRHPIRLESCQAIFDKNRFYIFSGARDAVDVLTGSPPLVPVADLILGAFDLGERAEPLASTPRAPERIEVELKLVPESRSRKRVTATLVRWAQAAYLKRLVYALPPTLLAGYRVTALAEGLLVIGEQGIDGLPIGEMFYQVAPSIYLPVGYQLLPRVSAEVLTDHLGGVNGRTLLIPLGAEKPLALEHTAFEPLGRRALARVTVEPRPRDERMPTPRPAVPATVVNEPVGTLPLWGFRDDGPGDS